MLLLDWSADPGGAPETFNTGIGVRVVRCTPRSLGRGIVGHATKFILSGRHVAKVARNHFDLESFDAAIAWMPAVAIAPLLPMLESAGIEHRILFIWDFFPDHHREIGRIPGGLPVSRRPCVGTPPDPPLLGDHLHAAGKCRLPAPQLPAVPEPAGAGHPGLGRHDAEACCRHFGDASAARLARGRADRGVRRPAGGGAGV